MTSYRLVLALTVTAGFACGGRSSSSTWVEREAHHDDGHAMRSASRPQGQRQIDVASIDTLDEAAVVRALETIGDAAPAGRLALRVARLAYHRGEEGRARAWLARAANAADEPEIHDQLIALGRELARPPLNVKMIAVLLPLSGTFASIGSELRAAIELAPAAGATWLFLDTQGDVDGAVAAVETAVARGALGILGPVGEREAVASARAAALRGIPIALLAPSDGADPGAGVFRMVGSAADEARAVARLAANEHYPTVGVLAPRDDAGRDATEALAAEASRLGITVTAQGSYDPTGGGLEADVKQFLGLVPAKNPRLAAHLARYGKKGWTTFSPDIPYTLLYVPDRYDRGALVAAFLPYFGVELRTTEFPDPARLQRKHGGNMPQVVQLVGGAGWNHPSLPVRGGNAVQGALILDSFAGDRGGDVAVQFAAAFQQRTSRLPSSAAAQAYDAATVVANARAAAARAKEPDIALRAELARAKLDDGACGAAAMSAAGELEREPIVLEVQGDQLILAP